MIDNKLGITDKAALYDAEERFGKRRALELYDSGALAGLEVGTFAGLTAIHKQLYGDVYADAGEIRTVDIVRGKMRFSPVNILDTSLGFVDIMPQSSFDDVVDKYIEMNVAHPFRRGNGIALRIWLNLMMSAATGKVIDWSKLDRAEFSTAMERCSVDDEMLYNMFNGALVPDSGRTTFVKNLDASFALDGFTAYTAAAMRG